MPWCWSGDGPGNADPLPVLVQLPLLLVEVGALRVNVADQLLVTLVYYLKCDGNRRKMKNFVQFLLFLEEVTKLAISVRSSAQCH